MVNKKHIHPILLAFSFIMLTGLLQAKDFVHPVGSCLIIARGAHVQIGKSASISGSNIITETNITGQGKLILYSENDVFIRADNHTIENLVVAAANKTELLSGLQITHELTILKGELILNNYNLTLGVYARTGRETLHKIVKNSLGVLIQNRLGRLFASCPFTFSTPVYFDFSSVPALIFVDPHDVNNFTFYYRKPSLYNNMPDVPVPPPKLSVS